MRHLALSIFLCATLFSITPALAQGERLHVSTRTDSLVKWTPKNLKERENLLSLPGAYTECGNYIFTLALTVGASPAQRLIGFGIASSSGGIDSVTAVDARGGRVRIWVAPLGTTPSVKMLRDDSLSGRAGHLIILPSDEYELVMSCLGAKKSKPTDVPKKTIRI